MKMPLNRPLFLSLSQKLLMKILVTIFALASSVLFSPAATFRMWDPQPYLSQLDSPFYDGIQGGIIYLEDFEDGNLNTPFVRDPLTPPQAGTTFRTQIPDIAESRIGSVDGDDGVLDFEGGKGDSWITYQTGGAGRRSFFEFEFLPNDEGQYPLFVGIVVTEVADVSENVEFIFRDPSGRDLNNDSEYDPRPWFDPGELLRGDVETHRFIGIHSSDGIQSLSIENAFQVDHLQYGYAIPEAGTTVLSMIAATAGLFRRRRSP